MKGTDLRTLFGKAIKAQRAALCISQEELAYRAGLHQTYVSDVERGRRNPSLETVEKLARALEISIASLFERASIGDGTRDLVEILLVEDDPSDVDMTQRAFRRGKIANPLHVVRTGEAALEFVLKANRNADEVRGGKSLIVLLDLNLPGMSGVEVLRRIKADRRTAGTPVIVLTESSRARDIAICRELGADKYLIKPVGFQNFSEMTPYFEMEWALLKGR
ncbi:MAG TPA: response regulator [Chthoniobacterales bacterium]|jgi:CheY-like chemotaxis protein